MQDGWINNNNDIYRLSVLLPIGITLLNHHRPPARRVLCVQLQLL